MVSSTRLASRALRPMTVYLHALSLLSLVVISLPFTSVLYADEATVSANDEEFFLDCATAGGIADGCELAYYCSLYDELRARIAPQSLRGLPAQARLPELHALLHAEILVGEYRKEASDLRLAIDRGDFNCLSATALYWDLAREGGLELEIWSLPGHVYLSCPQLEPRVVEPASKTWPAEAVAQNATPSQARRVTPTELIGKFYYNRGVRALERGEYAVGVELLRQSLMLDPGDREARTNLLAGLNNWAASLCRQKRYAAAQSLIFQGLAIDGGFAPLVANQRYVREKLAAP